VSTWAVRTEQERAQLVKIIMGRDLPFTADIVKGVQRSLLQNKLQRKWVKEAEEQGDCEAEYYRGYCKLHFGVKLMKFESPEWAEKYDRIIKPLPYEQKLEMMMEPFDFPVTRCLSTKGAKKYLDQMYDYFTGKGFTLTDPDNREQQGEQ
jgi:hypothetical protein